MPIKRKLAAMFTDIAKPRIYIVQWTQPYSHQNLSQKGIRIKSVIWSPMVFLPVAGTISNYFPKLIKQW